MAKEQTFYMALPKTEREKLRERQKLRVYREYTKNLGSCPGRNGRYRSLQLYHAA